MSRWYHHKDSSFSSPGANSGHVLYQFPSCLSGNRVLDKPPWGSGLWPDLLEPPPGPHEPCWKHCGARRPGTECGIPRSWAERVLYLVPSPLSHVVPKEASHPFCP